MSDMTFTRSELREAWDGILPAGDARAWRFVHEVLHAPDPFGIKKTVSEKLSDPLYYLALSEESTLSKAHPTDAAFDLVSNEDTYIPRGTWSLVQTGIKVLIPEGHVGLVCSRSGLAANRGLFVLNAPGVIDHGYTGEIGVILANMSDQTRVIGMGDRIAQLLIVPLSSVAAVDCSPEGWSEVTDNTQRGEAGFGSTGR